MASEASSSGIVEGWLRSVDMVQYTQAFLDNGYDDLEVCKQIGEADLNAIGVPNDHQREKLLQAVRVLREQGGAAVYFTLEDCDNCPGSDRAEVGDGSQETPGIVSGPAVAGKCVEPPHCEGSTLRLDVHDLGQQSLVSYPKAQLGYILRDKLVLENIDLSEPPYTTSDLVVCGSSLTALAMRFAEELTTSFMDVLEGLEQLWLVARNNDLCSDLCRSSSRGVYCGSQSFYYGYPYQYRPSHRLHHPGSPGSQPPPLPSCPPPVTVSGAYLDRCLSLQSHLDGLHYRSEQSPHQNYVYTDGESTASADDKKKGGSVFGRFLRNIGFRKSNRKGSYSKYQGDLSAYEISMSDEDRMALMILVKEGKISTHTALAVVQKFEEGRRAAGKVGPSDTGKENVCDTPSKKGKKKKSIRPLKSQSTPSTDDRHRCPQVVLPAECEQICRQRRVHSLGQLDVSHIKPHQDQQYNHQPTRVSLTRAMSCSPASTHSPRLTSHMEPPAHSRIYGPGHQQLQQPPPPSHYHHHHHGLNKVDALRERLTGRPVNTVPKTSSKTSLLSSGSDQSMECGMQTPLRVDPMSRQGVDRAAYNSNSTVSMNSESNSPISGRKKTGMQEALLKSHGSTSCSTGDDGISSENDDVEHNSKRSLQIDGGKERMPLDLNSQRLSRTKEAAVVKPPLLRQRSAPGSTPLCSGPVLGQAKVILDYVPAPHETDFLHLKKGDMINIVSMADSGVWVGVVGARKGKFRFDHVEVAIEAEKTICERKCGGHTDMPRTIDDFLRDMGLDHLTTLFLMNGYDDLDIFSELDDHDLDALHITDPDQRTKVLSAARLLVNWPEYKTSCPSSLLSMDSPSSRAGNSSCDSGCYAGGEAKQTRCRSHESRGCHGDETKVDTVAGNSPSPGCHFPCHLCGKPKPPRKYSGAFSQFPLGHNLTQSHYSPSHVVHCTRQSPYAPGHFQYNSPQQYGMYNLGHYGYHYSPAHSQYSQGHSQYALSVSRTLSELSVADNRSVPGRVEACHGRKAGNNTNNSLYATDNSSVDAAGQPALGDKASVGDRVSLTEEDQEIIAITYGTSDARKVTAPIQPYSGRSSQLDMLSSTLSCSACISSTGCAQCDESLLCDSMSCQQCAAYMSCSQCFPYRHYVNTTMRSDSKSSKMSCSSTCTQTTCLSPDRDDSSHSGGSNLIDYTTSSQGSYYMVRPNQGKPQQCCYYQQHYPPHQPVYSHLVVPAGAPPPAQLPSPTLAELARVSPISLTHAISNPASGLTLTLKPSTLAPPGDWSSHLGDKEAPVMATLYSRDLAPPGDWSSHLGDTEAPGMATLYSRGQSQTPDKSETGDGVQVKSPTRSLMPLVSTKLSAEMIDLAQLPYSTAMGHCGIPPLLVQRYSEELRQDVETMSVVLEQLREKQLRNLGRPCIQNESLSESCKSACDLQISSIHNFLVSIGLPMYQRPLAEGGVSMLEQLLKLKDAEIEQMTGADSRHLRRIAHALEWVQLKLASPSPGGRICS